MEANVMNNNGGANVREYVYEPIQQPESSIPKFEQVSGSYKLVEITKRPTLQVLPGLISIPVQTKVKLEGKVVFDSDELLEGINAYFRDWLMTKSRQEVETLKYLIPNLHLEVNELDVIKAASKLITLCIQSIVRHRIKSKSYVDFISDYPSFKFELPMFVANLVRVVSAKDLIYVSADSLLICEPDIEFSIKEISSDSFETDISLTDAAFTLERIFKQIWPNVPFVNIKGEIPTMEHLNGFCNASVALDDDYVTYSHVESTSSQDMMISLLWKPSFKISTLDSVECHRKPFLSKYPKFRVVTLFQEWLKQSLFGGLVVEKFGFGKSKFVGAMQASSGPVVPKKDNYKGKFSKKKNIKRA
jgi:hypothetical protein